jgi:hypothetical protein
MSGGQTAVGDQEEYEEQRTTLYKVLMCVCRDKKELRSQQKKWRNGASHERVQVITEVDRRGDRGAVPSEMPVIFMEASVVFSARDALFGADSALQDQHGILRPNIHISRHFTT